MIKTEKGKKAYFAVSLILLVSLLVLIFYLSAQTADDSSETSGGIIELIYRLFGLSFEQEVIRTLAHFCEYALLGALMSNALFSKSLKKHTLPSFLLSCLYALSDETHQLFVEGRAFQLSDLAVDFSGSLLGCALFVLLIFIFSKIKNKNGKSRNDNSEKELHL